MHHSWGLILCPCSSAKQSANWLNQLAGDSLGVVESLGGSYTIAIPAPGLGCMLGHGQEERNVA